MMPMRGWTRETRLLVVTIVLSVSVLLALARLRFPGQEPGERLALPVRPLQQIVERASFDDLTNAVTRAADRIRPAVSVIPLPISGTAAASLDLPGSLDPGASTPPRALAIYTGDRRWVSIARATGTIRDGAAPQGFSIAARDPTRSLVVFTGPAVDAPILATSRPTLPGFLVVADPTAAGVSFRPMFVASGESVPDNRWRTAVWPLVAGTATPGALVFSLEGGFVGAVTVSSAGLVLVPGDTVVNAAEHLERDRAPWSIGVHLQRLDADLGNALGATHGVAVTAVDPDGSAASTLLVGDVINAIDGMAVDDPDDVLLEVARSDPAAGVDLDLVRSGTRSVVHIAREQAAPPPPAARTPLASDPRNQSIGARLSASPRGARVDRVDRDGPASRAGLSPGDVIWWVQGAPTASPTAIARRWRTLPTGARLAIGVNPAAPRLLTLERP